MLELDIEDILSTERMFDQNKTGCKDDNDGDIAARMCFF